MPTELESFPFHAIFWDMDGTLLDSEPIWISEERRLMNSMGVEWTDADSLECLGGPMERVDSYMRMRAGNVHKPFELAEQLYQRMVIRLAEGVDFLPGARELIADLQLGKIPLALVSASTREIMDAALRSIDPHPFNTTISANDVVKTKPHPEGYLLAADRIGVAIQNCLIIEDSVTGMTAAIDSGAYVLGIPHAVELPSGAKVIHHPTLAGLTRHSIASLFSEIIE